MDNYNNIDENVEIDETNSPKLGNVVHSAGNAAKNTGKVVNTSGKAVQAGGKVVENSGKLIEKGGQLTQKAGQGIQKGGDALINAGNAVSSSGVGAIAGVPLTILGGLTKGIGVATDVAGKGMEYGGKGVEYAGKGINKTGQGISNVGQKTQNIGQKTSQATTPSQSEKVHSVEDSIDKAAQTTNKIKKNKTIIIIVCACTVPIIIMFSFMMLTAFASLSDNEAFANFPKYTESTYNNDQNVNFNCSNAKPNLNDYSNHNGIDVVIGAGTPVYPLFGGKIKSIGRISSSSKCHAVCPDDTCKCVDCNNGDTMGNYVAVTGIAIDGKEHTAYYMHFSRIPENLSIGQEVTQTDIIGYVGTTGCSTGNHLHIDFRDNYTSQYNHKPYSYDGKAYKPTAIYSWEIIKSTVCPREMI